MPATITLSLSKDQTLAVLEYGIQRAIGISTVSVNYNTKTKHLELQDHAPNSSEKTLQLLLKSGLDAVQERLSGGLTLEKSRKREQKPSIPKPPATKAAEEVDPVQALASHLPLSDALLPRKCPRHRKNTFQIQPQHLCPVCWTHYARLQEIHDLPSRYVNFAATLQEKKSEETYQRLLNQAESLYKQLSSQHEKE